MEGVRERGRVITLAVVMVLALAAGVAGYVTKYLSPPGTLPFATGQSPTLWPEEALATGPTAVEVQQQANTGSESVAWRLHPRQVATNFASTVLGWAYSQLNGGSPQKDGSFVVRVRRLACSTTAPCPLPVGGFDPVVERLILAQPVDRGPGGIWSVISVMSPRLRLPTTPDDVVEGMQHLGLSLDLPSTDHAAAGLAYADGCGLTNVASHAVDIRSNDYLLVVPDPLYPSGNPCTTWSQGYLFAYSTPKVVQQTGDPLRKSSEIDDLSMIPITVVAAGASPSATACSDQVGAPIFCP
jgi:hypothetical protein